MNESLCKYHLWNRFFTNGVLVLSTQFSNRKRRATMKKINFWIATGLLMIILPILVACANESSTPDDPLAGTNWNLVFYRKSSLIEGTSITAHFENGEINGSAGCNSYFGAYHLEEENISFGQIGVTEMYCMECLMPRVLKHISRPTATRRWIY